MLFLSHFKLSSGLSTLFILFDPNLPHQFYYIPFFPPTSFVVEGSSSNGLSFTLGEIYPHAPKD